MRQLSDILREKKDATKQSYAEIGRVLGGLNGQLIGKYANGKSMPSLDFAVKWKQAFDENLIDLMLEPVPNTVHESESQYNADSDLQRELNEVNRAYRSCMQEKEQIRKEFDQLKNFVDASREQQLNRPPTEPIPIKK